MLDSNPMDTNSESKTLGDNGRQRSLVCCSSWSHRVRHDLANWTRLASFSFLCHVTLWLKGESFYALYIVNEYLL